MIKEITAVKDGLLGIIYPAHCVSCKRVLAPIDRSGVCGSCLKRIRPNPKPHCRSCGRSLNNAGRLCPECRRTAFHFKRAWSAYIYEDVMKDLIHAYKYKALVPLSGILSGLMIDFIKDNMEIIDGIDMLTSVPLGRRRFIERGFNQASVLAKGVSDAFGIPFADTLIKRRRTAHQNELARDERLKNLKGAFAARNLSILKNKAVLLIDDVMTTGSTLDECSMVILSCGAAEVRCLTLARGA